jgi:hypothetical protein
MSVTEDLIPHGAQGYRKPWECRCDICKAGIAEYNRDRRAARAKTVEDELAAQRRKRSDSKPNMVRKPKKGQTESDDSVPKRGRRIGDMERAVVEECEKLELAKERPTVVVAARNLARMVDELSGTTKGAAVQVSTTKQLMAMIESLRPKSTGGKRKSGGRLATVGNLTKVKRRNESA